MTALRPLPFHHRRPLPPPPTHRSHRRSSCLHRRWLNVLMKKRSLMVICFQLLVVASIPNVVSAMVKESHNLGQRLLFQNRVLVRGYEVLCERMRSHDLGQRLFFLKLLRMRSLLRLWLLM
ncbi:transmembrane protein, putative [Medicago truncatula]|uniref:Transmembrane protein, putative n=1 Tax=Medicago truncatula TaxID=3880 RepID=A0A072TUG3_MEDTR|nr:transmembrane protein, putative [Medicago truncatula]